MISVLKWRVTFIVVLERQFSAYKGLERKYATYHPGACTTGNQHSTYQLFHCTDNLERALPGLQRLAVKWWDHMRTGRKSRRLDCFHVPFHILSLVHLPEHDKRIQSLPIKCWHRLLYCVKEDSPVSSLVVETVDVSVYIEWWIVDILLKMRASTATKLLLTSMRNLSFVQNFHGFDQLHC